MSFVTVTHRLTRRQTAALAEGDLSLESLTARARCRKAMPTTERDTTVTTTLFAAVNRSDRLGSPIWATGPTPDEALFAAERDGGLERHTLTTMPLGERLATLIDTGGYAPETRWDEIDGRADLPVEELSLDQLCEFTRTESDMWEDGGPAGESFRRARREAIADAAASGEHVEVLSHDGIVLDAWLNGERP